MKKQIIALRSKLIKQGVKKLKLFGFVNVNERNILIDEVYSLYFLEILNKMLDKNPETDMAINQLQRIMNFQNKTIS